MAELICILQHSGIGNLIHLTPMIQAMRQLSPDSEIVLFTHKRSARILQGWPVIDAISFKEPYHWLRSHRRKADWLVISPAGASFNSDLAALAENILETRIDSFWKKHEVEVHMDFAREAGYEGTTPDSQVMILPENHANAEACLKEHGLAPGQFVAISAGYLKEDPWPKKHLGNEKYRELLIWLTQKYDLPAVLLGCQEDRTNAEKITDFGELGVDLCGWSEDIKDSAAVISQAKFFLGNDTGLGHVASALKVPTVTIFTFTNPVKNTPRNGRVVLLPCPYRLRCQHEGATRCGENGCLDVPLEAVMEEVEQLISDL